MNHDFTPSGKILEVWDNPAYFFNGKQTIQDLMKLKNDNIKGYNTYFIAKNKSSEMKKLATLRSPVSGIKMNVYTTMRGCIVYTGDYLSDPFSSFSGLCIEAQQYPDAPNHTNFPDIFLEWGRNWEQIIMYAFETSLYS